MRGGGYLEVHLFYRKSDLLLGPAGAVFSKKHNFEKKNEIKEINNF